MKKSTPHKNKIDYINQWKEKNNKTFSTGFTKEEYKAICDCIKQNNINKSEFIRWTYDKLKEEMNG